MRHFVLTAWILLLPSVASADKLVRVAGGGTASENVPGPDAKLVNPFGVDFDQLGNMYMVELAGERVLKVDPKGLFTILAGTGKKGSTGDDGPARQATFNGMHALAVHPDGTVYVADTWNNRIRKIDPKSGVITNFAGTGDKAFDGDGGPALKAKFNGVFCISFNPESTKLYITDLGNKRIRVIDMKTNVVTTVAGNGKSGVPMDGSSAVDSPLSDPRAHTVDKDGNVYILERGGNALRVVDPQGKIRTVAGTGKPGLSGDDGPGLQAMLRGPKHLCMDRDGNVIVADTANHVIRKFNPKTGAITRLAGTGKLGQSGDGGDPKTVTFNEPHGVYVSPTGVLYIVDSNNHRVFRWEK